MLAIFSLTTQKNKKKTKVTDIQTQRQRRLLTVNNLESGFLIKVFDKPYL